MNTRIAEELENEALHRFHADFRRALLMYHKAALNLFFCLQFPMAEEPLYDGGTLCREHPSGRPDVPLWRGRVSGPTAGHAA